MLLFAFSAVNPKLQSSSSGAAACAASAARLRSERGEEGVQPESGGEEVCVVCRVQAEKKTQERERVFPQQNFRMVEASERFKNIDVV